MGKFLLLTCLVAAVKAEADADALLYSAYGPVAYAGYPPYAAAVPFGSSTGLDPITQGLDAVTQGVAIPAGYHYLGKRSADADAEADAGLLYRAAYNPYTYAARAYHPYGAYPYYSGFHYLGKRSADADAEADAEADAGLLYSAYSPYTYAAGAYHPYSYGAFPYYSGFHYLGKRSADADADAALYAAYNPYTYGAYLPYAYGAYSPYTYGAYRYW